MSCPSISAQTPLVFHPADDQTYALNFTQFGIGSRTISSVTSVLATPTGLTFASTAVIATTTTGEYAQSVAASKAIQFDMSGGTDATDYEVIAKVVLSDGSVMNGVFRAECRAA